MPFIRKVRVLFKTRLIFPSINGPKARANRLNEGHEENDRGRARGKTQRETSTFWNTNEEHTKKPFASLASVSLKLLTAQFWANLFPFPFSRSLHSNFTWWKRGWNLPIITLGSLARKFALFSVAFIRILLLWVEGSFFSFPPKFVAFCLLIMSAMKDITNLTSISSLNGHESSPERDIFVSFEAPSLRRKRTAKQASLHRFVQSSTETLENMSSEEDSSNKSGSEVEGEANSVFMTPESEPRLKASAQKRRRFRLEGSPRNSDSSSPELSRTLYGLSKVQLVDLFNALVTERHPDLEQVFISYKLFTMWA